jgi:hypothetical protein
MKNTFEEELKRKIWMKYEYIYYLKEFFAILRALLAPRYFITYRNLLAGTFKPFSYS